MSRVLELALWVLVWVAGVVAIGFVSGFLPVPFDLIASVLGGLVWGYGMGRVLFSHILDW